MAAWSGMPAPERPGFGKEKPPDVLHAVVRRPDGDVVLLPVSLERGEVLLGYAELRH